MSKKIKSFTVDEDPYNRLVAIFKGNGAKTSISMYLNNQVKWLVERLDDLEKGIKNMEYQIPMSFVIDEIVKDSERSGRLSTETYKDDPISELQMALMDWADSYDAYQKGIPYEYYGWLRNPNFMLSNDKKFLIDKETGKKFISTGKSTLMEVREIESEK